MSSAWDDLSGLASELAGGARRVVRAVERALGVIGPYRAVGYRGYGTARRALVLGRVVQQTPVATPDATQARWRNLLDALQRIDAAPLPRANVRVRMPGVERELVGDDEGFLRHWIELRDTAPSAGWHSVDLELLRAPGEVAASVPARFLVPPRDAELGVISDIDDTVLQSEMTSFLRAVQLLLFENARTRLPFPGVAAFYRALERGRTGVGANPIFYVSSNAWNLFDVISGFLDAHGIPTGPLLLRDWDLGQSSLGHHEHKRALISEILATYPELPFVLVGDSGQEDPEIYAALVREFPNRVRAIYIRNVTPEGERAAAVHTLASEVAAAGSTLLLADDTLSAARHAAAQGWIADEALQAIASDARADSGAAL